MLRAPSDSSVETRRDRRHSSMQLLKADLAALKARAEAGDGDKADVVEAVKDQLATYMADLREEHASGGQDAVEVRNELKALQRDIMDMRGRDALPTEAPTPAMIEIQRELGAKDTLCCSHADSGRFVGANSATSPSRSSRPCRRRTPPPGARASRP